MRNGLGRAVLENAELALSGDFAAIGETDFELFRYSLLFLQIYYSIEMCKKVSVK
jgi:hypothetical protein